MLSGSLPSFSWDMFCEENLVQYLNVITNNHDQLLFTFASTRL
jgi:hypothetical protein